MEYISIEEIIVLTAETRERRANAENTTNETLNEIGGAILNACITVHRERGPGLLESAYIIALVHELYLREISAKVQVPVEMTYKEAPLGKIYVIDILVEKEIVL